MRLPPLSAPPRRRDPRVRLFCARPQQLAPGVVLLRGGLTHTMNVYLLSGPGRPGVTAFDAGEQSMTAAILRAAAPLGGLRTVVLGHADTDHRGSAAALRAAGGGGTAVLCHPSARQHAEGDGGRGYWRRALLPPAVRALHALTHPWWDGGPVQIDGTLMPGDEVAGFTVIDLGGHAPGQIGLWREADRLALVSDALYLTDMFGRPQSAALPIDAYNFDREQARASLLRLADLEPRVIGAGHLGPLTGAALGDELRAIAALP